MRGKISFSEVFYQMYIDWTGKDSQEDYTYSYIWQTNQFGHFGLGFMLSILVYSLFNYFNTPKEYYIYVIYSQVFIWIFKETQDYFNIVKEHSGVLPVDKKLIIKDLITDLYFLFYGGIVAYLGTIHGLVWGLVVFACGLIPSIFLFLYWIRLKIYFQLSGTPHYNRLSNFYGILSDEEVRSLKSFVVRDVAYQHDWQHLLVFGPHHSGATSLAMGLATDYSTNSGYSRYMSFNRFLGVLNLEQEQRFEEGKKLLPWRHAELLVVDNVSIGNEFQTAFNPLLFEKNLLESNLKELNINTLQKQKTIWVVGNDALEHEWKAVFERLELDKQGSVVSLKLMERTQSASVN